MVLACALPYVSFQSGGHTQNVSIFSQGPGIPGVEYWFVAEPIGVVLIAIAGGVLVMTAGQGRLARVAAGGLIVSGIQTFLLFLGYALGYDTPGDHLGAGGFTGMVAGILIAAGGFLAVASQRTADATRSPALAAAVPPAGPGPAVPPYPSP